MIVLDPGHKYLLNILDSYKSDCIYITFVKREGPRYPGNVGSYPGTNIQEVLRACIDRIKYLDNQIPDERNEQVLTHLRQSIILLEERAAERHGRTLKTTGILIEFEPTCSKCGHIQHECK